jgi:hypothetical protein
MIARCGALSRAAVGGLLGAALGALFGGWLSTLDWAAALYGALVSSGQSRRPSIAAASVKNVDGVKPSGYDIANTIPLTTGVEQNDGASARFGVHHHAWV